jgi:hypothetical protein
MDHMDGILFIDHEIKKEETMSHKLEIEQKSIRLDGKEIGPSVHSWRYEFHPNHARVTSGKTACCVMLTRYVPEDVHDDVSDCTYVQTFYDIDVKIDLEGQFSHIVKPPFIKGN